MKKVLSLLVAGIILVSTSFSAFAAEASTSQKVMNQMEGAVGFLTEGKTAYTADDVLDYYTLVSSGVDMSKYNDGFLQNLKENLDKNSGRIVSTYGESLATYGAAILILDCLGKDPADFYGYDITKAFTAMDPEGIQASPYYYRVIIPATFFINDEQFTKTLCDFFVNTYYVMGSGMDSYGFNCDNTCYFITALAPYGDKYPEIMKDAFNVIENYKIEGGYFCDQYLSYANTDSTALALMAYSSYSPFDNEKDYYEKLNSIYADLCTFEGSKTGVFISAYSGTDESYATKEALMGLEKYYPLALEQEKVQNEETTDTPQISVPDKNEDITNVTEATENINKNDVTDVTEQSEKGETANTTTQKAEAGKNNSEKSPATGAGVTAVSFAFALGAGILATGFAKRKEK